MVMNNSIINRLMLRKEKLIIVKYQFNLLDLKTAKFKHLKCKSFCFLEVNKKIYKTVLFSFFKTIKYTTHVFSIYISC